jgi:hypothetical protein
VALGAVARGDENCGGACVSMCGADVTEVCPDAGATSVAVAGVILLPGSASVACCLIEPTGAEA